MWRPEWWPFKRSAPHVLRLGQAFIQLWQADGQGWKLLASRPAHHLAHDQHQALAELVADMAQALPGNARIQVLADSKWMPLSLLLTGKRPLSGEQVTGLARHRFAQVFGDQANAWRIQTTYVAGDEQALAFACPVGLESGLRQILKKRLLGLAPSLSWAWDHAWRSTADRNNTWLALAEQDRSILVWLSKGQAQALQPAGPLAQNPGQLLKAVQTEALRCGVADEVQRVRGASFEAMPFMAAGPASTGLHWHAFEAAEVGA